MKLMCWNGTLNSRILFGFLQNNHENDIETRRYRIFIDKLVSSLHRDGLKDNNDFINRQNIENESENIGAVDFSFCERRRNRSKRIRQPELEQYCDGIKAAHGIEKIGMRRNAFLIEKWLSTDGN